MAMSAEERQQMLLTQPVEKIIPKMALPTICSMLITSIYNMADTYFVSQIGTAEATASGTSASAAVGIVFSVMAMIQALAFMFGMGSGTNATCWAWASARRRKCTARSVFFPQWRRAC